MSTLLTPEQVCGHYGISKWTLYRWTSKNLIPHLKIGGMVRFKEDVLKQWEEKGVVKTELI